MTNQPPANPPANPQAPPQPPSKLKSVLMFIYVLLMVFYTAYGLIQAIQAYVKFRDLSKSLNNIVKNWQQDLIIDFQFVTAGSECPTDYRKEFTFGYGGASLGCDCEQITPAQNITQQIYLNACNSTQTQVGCIERPEVPAVNFTSWAVDNIAGNARVICVKRKKGTNFITEATKLNADGTCAAGSIECGSSAAIDPARLKAMCVPQDLGGCPVMDISSSSAFA